MRNYLLLLTVLTLIIKSFHASAQTPIVTSIGFIDKDTIEVLEGKSKIIEVLMSPQKTSGLNVNIKLKVVDKDSLETKGIVKILLTTKTITFKPSDESPYSFFRLETKVDDNDEDNFITLELVDENNDTIKLKNSKIVIKIKDVVPPKVTIENIEAKIRQIIEVDKDTSEVIGVVTMNTNYFKSRHLSIRNKKPTKSTASSIVDKKETLYLNKENNIPLKDYLSTDSIVVQADSKEDDFSISKVEILFRNGFASEIKAFDSKNGNVYQNLWYRGWYKKRKRFGISFRDLDFKNTYKNYLLLTKNNKSIALTELIDYNSSTGRNFVPDDGLITLTPKSPSKNLTVKTSLKSFIDVNIFSDFLSILKSDRGNALIQTELSSKIYLNTTPVSQGSSLWLHYVKPSLIYRRFENGFDNIKGRKDVQDTNSVIVDRLQVKQRTYLEIGIKGNIFNGISRHYNNIEVNAFTNFGWFNLQGMALQNNLNSNTVLYESIPSNTLEFGLELKWLVLKYRNFGFTMGGSAMAQKIWNNKGKKVSNGEFSMFYSPEYELFYFPIANSKDKIFLRAKYMTNDNKDEQNYSQLQIGYQAEFKLPNSKLKP